MQRASVLLSAHVVLGLVRCPRARARAPSASVRIADRRGVGPVRARAARCSFGRWYLSQQDARQPAQWLLGASQCPTCRARFCLLDIVAIRPEALPTDALQPARPVS